MQFQGAWPDAMAEASRACERCERVDRKPPAAALYQQAEIHRLRGEFEKAEEAYRAASQLGCDPQPGLALLRMAQGRTDAARAAIRRLVSATTDRLQRARLLPAHLEIMLATGDIEEARGACGELQALAESFDTDVLRAMAAQAQGAIELAGGDARAALGPLRCAFEVWERLEAPYESARVRVLIGLACRAVGDDEAGALEFDAARAAFERLGAQPELSRIDALAKPATSRHEHPLTPRERDVLRLIADRQHQQGHRGRVVPERANHGQAREQYPRQARCPFTRRRHGLRVRPQALLTSHLDDPSARAWADCQSGNRRVLLNHPFFAHQLLHVVELHRHEVREVLDAGLGDDHGVLEAQVEVLLSAPTAAGRSRRPDPA